MNNMFGLYSSSAEDDKMIARWEIEELRRQLAAAEYKASLFNFWHIFKRVALTWKLCGAYEKLDQAVQQLREHRRNDAPFRL